MSTEPALSKPAGDEAPASEERGGIEAIRAAMARAPRVDRLTPEQLAELDQQVKDIRAGRRPLVRHEDRDGWFEEHAAELGDGDG